MSEGKKVSTNFSVVIISFLIFTTIIVFAVLLFLSYENMYNNLTISVSESTENCAKNIASDFLSLTGGRDFVFQMDDDGSKDFEVTKVFSKYINSNMYMEAGSVYVVTRDGTIIMRNQLVGDGMNQISADKGIDSKYHIIDVTALTLLSEAEDNGATSVGDRSTNKVVSLSCIRLQGTPYYVLVKNATSTSVVFNEFLNIILIPAIIAMVIAILLYVAFIWLSLEPIKDISNVISRVADGDFKARVSQKYVEANDFSNLTISSELTEMAVTVNNMIESLQNQEKDRELFISSIAHDIRTPLTSINGFVTAMNDGTIPPENYDKYLNLIKQETNRIRKLVVSMTEASSLSHVDPDMMEEFNTEEMLRDVVDNLEGQFKDKDIKVILSLDPGPDNIAYGDAQQLCRVVMNIITNAIKFTPTGGYIKVSSESVKRDRKIKISIEDSGPGIPENKRKRIFDSFYQADASRKSEGFGLGLYICKQILAGHEQTIVCDESGELGGACFKFSFGFPPEEQ